ncbi:MAG: DUF427 domain-containing protein [Rhodospirillales bacterium]
MQAANDADGLSGVIRNPANANHFMAIKPVAQPVRIYAGEVLLADTKAAIRLQEVGRSVYDPVIYVPEQDVSAALTKTDRSTHCPLKGDASYYALAGEEIAWSYEAPLDFASQLAGYRAFWASKVKVVEGA